MNLFLMPVPAISLCRMLYEGAPCENLPTSANLNGAARTLVSASVNSNVGPLSPVKTVPKSVDDKSVGKYLCGAGVAGFEARVGARTSANVFFGRFNVGIEEDGC